MILLFPAVVALIVALLHGANGYYSRAEKTGGNEASISILISLASLISAFLLIFHLLKERGWLG